jgi:hypothetical protein
LAALADFASVQFKFNATTIYANVAWAKNMHLDVDLATGRRESWPSWECVQAFKSQCCHANRNQIVVSQSNPNRGIPHLGYRSEFA